MSVASPNLTLWQPPLLMWTLRAFLSCAAAVSCFSAIPLGGACAPAADDFNGVELRCGPGEGRPGLRGEGEERGPSGGNDGGLAPEISDIRLSSSCLEKMGKSLLKTWVLEGSSDKI